MHTKRFAIVLPIALVLTLTAACRRSKPEEGKAEELRMPVPKLVQAQKAVRAHLRLPAGCDLAARIDLRSVLALDQTKGHQHEVQARVQGKSDAGVVRKGGAYLRLLTEAGISPEQDIEEVAVCLQQQETPAGAPDTGIAAPVRFLVIVSGAFEPGKVIETVASNAPKAMWQPVEIAGMSALRRQNGRILAQASDGTILFSDQQTLLESAAAVRQGGSAYSMPDGHVALVAGVRALDSLRTRGGRGQTHPLGELLGEAIRLEMGIDLGTSILHAQMLMPNVKAAQANEFRIREIFKVLALGAGSQRMGALLPAGTLESLAKAKIVSREAVVVLDATLPPAALAGLVHQAAILGTPGPE